MKSCRASKTEWIQTYGGTSADCSHLCKWISGLKFPATEDIVQSRGREGGKTPLTWVLLAGGCLVLFCLFFGASSCLYSQKKQRAFPQTHMECNHVCMRHRLQRKTLTSPEISSSHPPPFPNSFFFFFCIRRHFPVMLRREMQTNAGSDCANSDDDGVLDQSNRQIKLLAVGRRGVAFRGFVISL